MKNTKQWKNVMTLYDDDEKAKMQREKWEMTQD